MSAEPLGAYSRCPKCQRALLRADFGPKDRTRKPNRLCLRCDAEKVRAYYQANRERKIAQIRAYEADNPEWYAEQKRIRVERARLRRQAKQEKGSA